jgi:hypothetical protein
LRQLCDTNKIEKAPVVEVIKKQPAALMPNYTGKDISDNAYSED